MGALDLTLDIFIRAWPTLEPNSFDGDEDHINDFTFRLADSKIDELNAVSTTSALIAGIVAATYSWPLFSLAPWPAQTCFGTSFILSLSSIRKALQQNYVLRRLKLYGKHGKATAGDRIRQQFAEKDKQGSWHPVWKREVNWNSSLLLLNLSIVSLLIGYGWTILGAAVAVNFDPQRAETKIASSLIGVAAIAVLHYLSSGVWIYKHVKTHRS